MRPPPQKTQFQGDFLPHTPGLEESVYFQIFSSEQLQTPGKHSTIVSCLEGTQALLILHRERGQTLLQSQHVVQRHPANEELRPDGARDRVGPRMLGRRPIGSGCCEYPGTTHPGLWSPLPGHHVTWLSRLNEEKTASLPTEAHRPPVSTQVRVPAAAPFAHFLI